ncbi:MAG: TrkA family potassium uptake protein [Arcanobacterium sp.]|nr:TrkA family potassium uptake protein [Arcanobacterium sp.]
MGCGRVGATLAQSLSNRGHSVAVIDRDAEAFRRLPEDFPGQQVTGVGFDLETLRQAGIEDAQGFAAVSSGDNSNIIAARVVKDNFGIENVVTRIYDTSRADVYERLGIATVPTVKWTSEQMMRKLINFGPHINYNDPIYQVTLFTVDLDPSWYGKTIDDVEQASSSRLAYIGRGAKTLMPKPEMILQDGDVLHLLAPNSRTLEVQRILNHPAEEEIR